MKQKSNVMKDPKKIKNPFLLIQMTTLHQICQIPLPCFENRYRFSVFIRECGDVRVPPQYTFHFLHPPICMNSGKHHDLCISCLILKFESIFPCRLYCPSILKALALPGSLFLKTVLKYPPHYAKAPMKTSFPCTLRLLHTIRDLK